MSGVSESVPELRSMTDDWHKPFRQACELIAPVWPLDQWIAVNPFWGLRHLPASRADQVLGERGGFSMLMPTEFYREAWQGGRIRREDLQASIAERGDVQNTAWYLDWLGRAPSTRAPLKSSILDTYRLASDDDQGGLADTACDQGRVCVAPSSISGRAAGQLLKIAPKRVFSSSGWSPSAATFLWISVPASKGQGPSSKACQTRWTKPFLTP